MALPWMSSRSAEEDLRHWTSQLKEVPTQAIHSPADRQKVSCWRQPTLGPRRILESTRPLANGRSVEIDLLGE